MIHKQDDRRDHMLFELLRGLRLLLEHFGLEDKAGMIQGEFVCCPREDYPHPYFRGSYVDCLYYVYKHPSLKIIPVAEADLYDQYYRIVGNASYDQEYCQMLRENRLVDKELRRRQKVRRKRRGRPPKK